MSLRRIFERGHETGENRPESQEDSMSDFIKPSDLQKVAAEKEMACAREIAEADKRRADELHQLQQAFMDRQLHPDVKTRVSTALRAAAEHGENHLQVMIFPSELCNDGGRAINNGDSN